VHDDGSRGERARRCRVFGVGARLWKLFIEKCFVTRAPGSDKVETRVGVERVHGTGRRLRHRRRRRRPSVGVGIVVRARGCVERTRDSSFADATVELLAPETRARDFGFLISINNGIVV